MNTIRNYRTRFEKRYLLKDNNFWSGFLFFFGAAGIYSNAIRKIRETSDLDALREDVKSLNQDSHKIFLELKLQDQKALVDAC
jgi:hypothetical protein